ncbi:MULTISPECIES: 4-hydroxythreonine-4-phosphate dehydrogenase PdxA [Clostridia]|uniref:4-hydroxythreonine-4-phosphate dehydrogenase PdxA n=1 Tax=Clostridia TaxID=186801 RepID=UPI000EA086FC|nr:MULTISPECIES: 4-hydroxythreonine-4-phosphate dehydrogenase PdxA [Clostridia]NBJ71317.1 4-hydroxythreonine-4-phosphate dehydrogenase PdxA [Roseburia sp. 1XD42-34]RKI74724.1 4-hydroxythreonine-4-phosphate dehydrogenase PdxA [Clostridium sp. 1xD42-85]
MTSKPIIGITMGDAAGVGPEIIIKSLEHEEVFNDSHPVVIGDAKMLERAKELLKANVSIKQVNKTADFTATSYGEILCVDLDMLPGDLKFGEVSGKAGNAAFHYLKIAIELANEGRIDAICTAPLNKEALHKGGHIYPGHTEILAKLTGTKDFSMMLSSPKLKVIHVTTHVGLIEAINQIKPDRVYKVIKLAHDTLSRSGLKQPKIGVCGINPHAGENGLFGYGEEEEKIVPAIAKAVNEGMQVEGPLPADTLFFRAQRGDFDIVVAMYHDQGHSPIKVLGLEAGVNITVGLPIIRTSVDHGTAFDIAGKGIADEGSMLEALRQAIELAPVK